MATDRTPRGAPPKPGSASRRKPGQGPLTEEDARLWARVTETAAPLSPRKGSKAERSVRFVAAGDRENAPPPPGRPARSPGPRPLPPRTPPAAATAAPPLARFDPREARQVAGGRQAIDARVDLHGLTQRDAHGLLLSRLAAARRRGARTVLVITGKGGEADADEPFWAQGERGVLRRSAPQWLSSPEFRRLVVGFTEAHRRHGGAGALYVRLRRKGGGRPKE